MSLSLNSLKSFWMASFFSLSLKRKVPSELVEKLALHTRLLEVRSKICLEIYACLKFALNLMSPPFCSPFLKRFLFY